jgi:hypothetical protein
MAHAKVPMPPALVGFAKQTGGQSPCSWTWRRQLSPQLQRMNAHLHQPGGLCKLTGDFPDESSAQPTTLIVLLRAFANAIHYLQYSTAPRSSGFCRCSKHRSVDCTITGRRRAIGVAWLVLPSTVATVSREGSANAMSKTKVASSANSGVTTG